MSPMRGVKSIIEGLLLGGELNVEVKDSGDEASSEDDLLRLRVILYGVVCVDVAWV